LVRLLLILLVSLLPVQAGADLLASYKRGDAAGIARHAQVMGAAGLAETMTSANRVEVLAAIAGAPFAEDALSLLDDLALRAAEADRTIAVAAARSAQRISGDLDATAIRKRELTGFYLRECARRWSALALDPGRHSDLRVLATEVAAKLRSQQSGAPSIDLAPLFSDPDPQVAYAALVLTHREHSLDKAARQALGSKSGPVALGAAQRFCGPLGRATPPSALDAAAASQVQKLAQDTALDLVARLDLAPCLARSSKGRSVLRLLASRAPKHLRKALARLGKQ
jgi:hypothetical protein